MLIYFKYFSHFVEDIHYTKSYVYFGVGFYKFSLAVCQYILYGYVAACTRQET